MAVYKPKNVKQGDGSAHQWENCTMASAATALDRHTLGKKTSTGAKMRSCQNDQVGGTTLDAAKQAWARCYSEYLDVRLALSWTTFVAAIKSGRGAIIQGWYAELGPYACQSRKTFNHAVYINEVRANGDFLMYDPLCKTAKWVPATVVQRFAGKLVLGGSWGRLGIGKIYAGFTRITPPVNVPTTPKPPVPPKPPVTPKPPAVAYRFGGTPTNRGDYVIINGPANVRRSPYVRPDNVVGTAPTGKEFHVYQTTNTGTSVKGNRRWYGDATGTRWVHSSLAKPK